MANTIVLLGCAVSAVVAVAAFAADPDPPPDTIGSIISSFRLSSLTEPYALGLYRDGAYVYGLTYAAAGASLYRYSAQGSFLASFAVASAGVSSAVGHSHLGPAYYATAGAAERRLFCFRTTGGSPVSSFAIAVSGTPTNLFWDGTYYNVASSTGLFYRYRTTGAAAGVWNAGCNPCSGAAYAPCANNSYRPYLVVCSNRTGSAMSLMTYPAGSVVRTWSMPASVGTSLVYGESSWSSAYGGAIWACWYTGTDLAAVEIDIDARTASVCPASLGAIKALYR